MTKIRCFAGTLYENRVSGELENDNYMLVRLRREMSMIQNEEWLDFLPSQPFEAFSVPQKTKHGKQREVPINTRNECDMKYLRIKIEHTCLTEIFVLYYSLQC